jgi:hypothetical protein
MRDEDMLNHPIQQLMCSFSNSFVHSTHVIPKNIPEILPRASDIFHAVKLDSFFLHSYTHGQFLQAGSISSHWGALYLSNWADCQLNGTSA